MRENTEVIAIETYDDSRAILSYKPITELIRCKDCKFWHTSHCPMAYREYEYNRGNEPNDFCSLAEKREE